MENTPIISLNKSNIENEHICCAISDKKCAESYLAKKDWLKKEFDSGYVFRRIDARAKVFIEYGPAENGWAPIDAPNYLMINCFWVSGQYKGKGYGKDLLQLAINDAIKQGKHGLATVTGIKKFHFMSDTKWLLRQGFEMVQKTSDGFALLVKKIDESAPNPVIKPIAVEPHVKDNGGLAVYYSNRCPFSEYHVLNSLKETAEKRKLPLEIIKIESADQAQNSPVLATIFSLFYKGKFITTDISVCMDSRFDKLMAKFL